MGAVTVAIENVPTGVEPTVTIRAGGVARVLHQSRLVDSLPPGDYEVRAEPIQVEGVTWDAEPATQIVNVRATQASPRINIRFRPRGATLVLAAEGVPSYARGTVRVTGPRGYERVALTGDSLHGLSAGSYTLVAEGLETTDGRFEAVPSERTAELQSFGRTTVSFAYGPAKASLTISVLGLPGAASAGIAVTGPQNFSQRVDATRTLGGLESGLYVARTARVSSGGFSYDPDATHRDVSLSGVQRRTLSFSYSLATGAIAVTVAGLPSRIDANVVISGPAGFTRTVTATQTITDLAPGAYRLTASTVSAGGVSYAAQPTTLELEVTASQVAVPAEVRYNGSVGELDVEVDGLPPTATALVKLTAPDGEVTWIPGSQVLEGLAPGQYLLEAQTVTGTSDSWDPQITSRQLQVTANARTSASITYRSRAGQIDLSILGLPTGVAGAVRITGPGTNKLITSSTIVSGLYPGTYTLTAAAVTSGGTQYTASPASLTIDVVRGVMKTATVSYGGQSTSLTVNITGLPGGLAPSVTVTGPSGFTRQLSAATVLENLVPGTYRISSARVSSTVASYDADETAVDVSLAPGARVTHLVNYELATGSLAVSVSGLPSGTTAAVTVSGPSGFTRSLTSTSTLTKLAPGSYTVTAANVSAGGSTYTASPASRTVTVGASLVASAAPVSYATSVGAIRITMSGLPSATSGAVTLLGPSGATQSLAQSGVVSGLAVGAWQVRGNTVTSAEDRYAATPDTRTVTVLAADTVEAPVAFARITGHLGVTVSGLPSGTAADITVSGPSGFSRSVNSTQTLKGLEAGIYTISASSVVVGSTSYTPSSASQVVTVEAGGSLARSVAYSGQSTSLTVNVSGVPSGATAAVTVSGPEGYSQSVSTSTTLSGLASGTYSIAASRIIAGNFGFIGAPASQSVALTAGQSKSASVAYAVSSGALAVTVAGLPSGASAPVTVSGPSGFTRAVPSTQTLTDLAPGTYTVTATSTTSGATSFTPSSTSQSVTVSAGVTATRSVTFTGNSTSLTVSVNGVPEGADASVTVTGPGGFSRALSETQTFTELAAGTYTVTASSLTSGGFTYAASPASANIALTTGQSKSHTVTYAASTGRLNLTVSGLPTGTDAVVLVTGDGNFMRLVTQTTTLDELLPGTYSIASSNVTSGGTLYTPSSATQSVTISAGASQARSVSYTGSGTTLAVAVSGVPSGASGSVAVTGPSGYSRTVGTTTTLSGLAAGTYTLTPVSFTWSGYVYSGTPATQSIALSAGQSKSGAVTFAPSTGRLTVNIGGLPTGTGASVTVTGPGTFSQTLSSGTTLTALAPGSYTVTASSVTVGGTLYTPSATTQTVSVTAGATASRSVSYSGTSTSLALTISGVPTGASGNVLVTGPGGFSEVRTATGTLTGLAAGTYTVAARTITSGGYSYGGTPASQSVSLTAGQSKSATVTYASTTGRLTVNVSGLPSGTTAAVTVSGPGGFSQTVAGTSTLSSLVPGTYTVAAGSVAASGSSFTPSSTSQTVAVTAGATASRTVTYTSGGGGGGGGTGPNLVLEAAHVTQAIQKFDGTVPLVAGREALLRVFVTTPSTNSVKPDVRVRLYDGSSLFRTLTITAPGTSVPTAIAEGTLASTWNATLNANDLRTNLRILVDVDPGNSVAEPDETDNVWPRSGTKALDVRPVAPFNVVFVPIRQSVNGRTGNVTTGNLEGTFLSMTRRMFPLKDINASVRSVYTTNAPALQSNDGNSAWLTILSEMNSLRVAEASPAHYYGIVNPSYTGGIAGYAYVPGRAGVGWDKPGSALRVTAHELGHNFGRRHVAACGSGNTDPNYPYSGGAIGNYGFNQGTGTIVNSTVTDIMGYCSTQWISDYTWSNVMNFRGTGSMASFSGGPQPVLMVWGRVHRGVVTLEPAVRMVTRPVVADRPGQYRLELRDKTGRTMTGFTFTPDDIDHDGEAQAFAFAVPLDAVTEGRLVSVAVVGGSSGTVEQTASAAMTQMMASGATATPLITGDDGTTQLTDPSASLARSGTATRVTWDDAAWPAAIVRDASTGQVLSYLRQSGDEFVAGSGGVRITFSNGIRSATREYPAR